MTGKLPEITTLASESSSEVSYDNHPIAKVNDHLVRISVMTQPYPWHLHPNSDETFLVIEGRLNIEFEDGTLELASRPDGDGSAWTPASYPCRRRSFGESPLKHPLENNHFDYRLRVSHRS